MPRGVQVQVLSSAPNNKTPDYRFIPISGVFLISRIRCKFDICTKKSVKTTFSPTKSPGYSPDTICLKDGLKPSHKSLVYSISKNFSIMAIISSIHLPPIS